MRIQRHGNRQIGADDRAQTFQQHARVVVNATGAWADHVAALAGVRPIGLVPKRRTAIIVDGLPDIDTRSMPTVDFTATDAYFKPDGGRIMASLGEQDPVEAQDVRPDEWEIALLADRLQRETKLTARRIGHSWAGLRSFVSDDSPVVGLDDGVPDFFWLAAQGGYGIMMAPALGRAAAALALHHDLPVELMTHGIDAAGLGRSRLAPPKPG
ncbi:MAG: FAD-binding oxidoreductase [Rhodobacter sp.]|nr:FAD-binding oxidoreductase [Rhodobacter sp.]